VVLIALFISEQGSVFGANLLAQKYSPTQRKCFVRGYRLAGARPLDNIASAGGKGASLYASWAENGGWNYGGGYKFANLKYNSETTNYLNLSVFELDFTLLERMAIIDGFPDFVRNRGYKKC